MVTVIIFVFVIVLICKVSWNMRDDFSTSFILGVVAILFVIGVLFPFYYGAEAAKKTEPVIIEVTEIDGKYYYDDNGKSKDVLTIQTLTQSDELRVEVRKAPFSVWYWPTSYKEAYIPVVQNKDIPEVK